MFLFTSPAMPRRPGPPRPLWALAGSSAQPWRLRPIQTWDHQRYSTYFHIWEPHRSPKMATHHATSCNNIMQHHTETDWIIQCHENIIHHTETYTFPRSGMCFTDSWSHWMSLVVVELPCRSSLNIFLGSPRNPWSPLKNIRYVRYVYFQIIQWICKEKHML